MLHRFMDTRCYTANFIQLCKVVLNDAISTASLRQIWYQSENFCFLNLFQQTAQDFFSKPLPVIYLLNKTRIKLLRMQKIRKLSISNCVIFYYQIENLWKCEYLSSTHYLPIFLDVSVSWQNQQWKIIPLYLIYWQFVKIVKLCLDLEVNKNVH